MICIDGIHSMWVEGGPSTGTYQVRREVYQKKKNEINIPRRASIPLEYKQSNEAI